MSGNKAAGPTKVEALKIKRILVCVDGSEFSMKAARAAIMLAEKHVASLVVLNVVLTPSYLYVAQPGAPPMDLSEYFRAMREEANKLVNRVADMATAEGVKAHGEVLEGDSSAVGAITDFAKNENVDVIVIGTRGLG
jgi:nucleotide-binding universal stress UspA family protein